MKTLILVRHAKSDWHSSALSDFERPLSRRGETDAPKVGAWLSDWLSEKSCIVDRIVSSSAMRTRQTAIAVAHQTNMPVADIVWDKSLYLASLHRFQSLIERSFEVKNVIVLVGHNPGIEEVLLDYCPEVSEQLVQISTSSGKLMTTANIAIISFNDIQALHQKQGQCVALIRPKSLT